MLPQTPSKYSDKSDKCLHFKDLQKVHGKHCLISVEETPHLDGKHVVFGEVLEGYDEASPLFCLTVDSVDGWWILDAGCQEDGSSSKSQKSS